MTGASLPRLIAIMGSGETSPTMVKTHRALLDRLGPPPVTAVLLDTPFGFQMNASDICDRAVAYFHDSVGHDIEVAQLRSAAAAIDVERAGARIRAARYVFAGPGSPSYALRQWADSPVPSALADKIAGGGCVTFASAAALTLGAFTVPVYEIYKVGEPVRWLDGLDLMRGIGLNVAIIPHYDNAEGGNHDTRFCYLGEERLRRMEADLPSDAFILGVDEHTAFLFDLDAGSATVVGRGGVTVRQDARSVRLEVGAEINIAELAGLARDGRSAPAASRSTEPAVPDTAGVGTAGSPLLEAVGRSEAAFAAALEARDVRGAVEAILDLDQELIGWAGDTLQSDEMDRARSALRSMVVRLGEVAEVGAKDPKEVVGPFVEAVLAARRAARDQRRWDDADALRDHLLSLGVDVHDTPSGTTWNLRQ